MQIDGWSASRLQPGAGYFFEAAFLPPEGLAEDLAGDLDGDLALEPVVLERPLADFDKDPLPPLAAAPRADELLLAEDRLPDVADRRAALALAPRGKEAALDDDPALAAFAAGFAALFLALAGVELPLVAVLVLLALAWVLGCALACFGSSPMTFTAASFTRCTTAPAVWLTL